MFDACGGQNRNYPMARFNLYMVNSKADIHVIEQFFMETGHSYLPNDRDFADVSRALKHQNQVVSPEQWYDLVRNARLRNPFKVRELKRENFISLNGLDRHLINRRKNEDHNGVEWLKIKAMKFEKGSLFMYYKYSLKDDDIWIKAPIKAPAARFFIA